MTRNLAAAIREANASLMVAGDESAIERFFAADYVVHLTDELLSGGHALVRRALGAYRKAFSEITAEIEILVQDRDRIAWQRTLRAVHTGAFQGFPATGRAIIWRDLVVTRFHDGLIAEDWLITDLAEQLLRGRKSRG